MQERHSGENIMQRMGKVIAIWKLDDKMTGVVTDNASNGTKALNAQRGILELNGLTCSAHSLQMSINKALCLKEIDDLCWKSGKLVAHFRHSTIASDKLSSKATRAAWLANRAPHAKLTDEMELYLPDARKTCQAPACYPKCTC
ncbi:hypothetical protein MRX96_022029 [Rhipicephalus microplus]